MIKVVVDPLSPLHDHVRDLVIGGYLVRGDDACGHESRCWFRVTVVQSGLVPTDGLRETVFVDGFEDSTETSVRRAPGRMRQIVALAVHCTVAVVVAKVQTVVGAPVRRAARQTLQFGQLDFFRFTN